MPIRLIVVHALVALMLLTGATVTHAAAPAKEMDMTVDDIPFVNGPLNIPPLPSGNNRGVITDQTVPGQTHIEAYLIWRLFEPSHGAWDFGAMDEMLALSRQYNLKMLVFPWVMYAPEWFKQTADYTPLTDMQTGATVDNLSPWAPGTRKAFDYFYGELARRYRDDIDIILLAYPGSDYGEVGMVMGAPNFVPGGGPMHAVIPQDPTVWKLAWWCGDPYARADFRRRMLEKHGGLERLNTAWGTAFGAAEAIDFPDPDTRGGESVAQRRRWLDFVGWLQESQTRTTVELLEIIRRHFPTTRLEVALGYGSDQVIGGYDRTAVIGAIADYKPIGLRSTHGSFNRDQPPRAYWFYKRMAPLCHRLGIGFGTEPPGGDLTADELRRQYFEDASAGVNLVFTYFQNYHKGPDIVGDFKRVLRPHERSRVDIGILYPSTQMRLDMSHFPEGQMEFCAHGRDLFDYDVVDENLVEWGALEDYKVLLHTSGAVYEADTLNRIDAWLRGGGVLVTRGAPQWEDVDGKHAMAATWLTGDPLEGAPEGTRIYRIGKGRLHVVDETEITGYLTQTAGILASMNRKDRIHGFDGTPDGQFTTEFPSGRLVFDTKTLQTRSINAAE